MASLEASNTSGAGSHLYNASSTLSSGEIASKTAKNYKNEIMNSNQNDNMNYNNNDNYNNNNDNDNNNYNNNNDNNKR